MCCCIIENQHQVRSETKLESRVLACAECGAGAGVHERLMASCMHAEPIDSSSSIDPIPPCGVVWYMVTVRRLIAVNLVVLCCGIIIIITACAPHDTILLYCSSHCRCRREQAKHESSVWCSSSWWWYCTVLWQCDIMATRQDKTVGRARRLSLRYRSRQHH